MKVKRSKTIAAAAIIIVSGAVLLLRAQNRTQEGLSSAELADIENAIIINGIEMSSNEPQIDVETDSKTGKSAGKIIYDDSIVSVGSEEVQTLPRGKGKSSDFPSGKTIMESLKKKDGRFHLVDYVIQSGDNLWNIAERSGVSHTDLIHLNGIRNADCIRSGRIIKVPSRSGVYHTVKKGDTLTELASVYNADVERIERHNKIKKSLIIAGERIFIPDGRMPREAKADVSTNRSGGGMISSAKTGKTQIASSTKKSSTLSGLKFAWPLRGRITSGFGRRTNPIEGGKHFHCGIDISVNSGTPVKAAESGKVIFSGWKGGYGKAVIIRHAGGYISVYAHNSENLCSPGQAVKKGEVVAKSGMTGAVTGAHLHFEIRKYVTPLNPMRFL